MFARAAAGLLGGLCILGTGCSFLLPKDKEQVESPWVSFSEAKSAYDEIVPGETTVAGLQELGFDPRRTPNVEELSYIEVLGAMIPAGFAITPETMGPLLKNCFDAQTRCRAYRAQQRRIRHNRFGIALLDLLNFWRRTRTTGWELDATFLMVDDLVIHKLWSGKRKIERYRSRVNPLGPLNELSGALK